MNMAAQSATALTLFFLLCLLVNVVRCGHYIQLARQERPLPLIINAVDENAGKGQKSTLKADQPYAGGRQKRDAGRTPTPKNQFQPIINVTELLDPHQQVMIDWAGEGSEVVICVTRDTKQTSSSASNIHISYNYGSSYLDKTENFKTKSGKKAIINKFYKNDKYTSRFVFTDVINKYMHMTADSGKTIRTSKVVFTPSEVSHHPLNPDVMLVYDTEDDERKIWVTEDFGQNWRMIGLFVKSYYWSEITEPPTLYIEREEPSGSASVVASQELFRDGSVIKTIITDVEDFEVKEEFLFAIKKVHLLGAPTSDPQLQLWISYRQGPFLRAEFPNSMSHQHYYIADVSEGQIMVCVAHDQVMSNLYVSSVPRSANHQVRFSLSLERILYFNPSTNWVDTWLSEVADKTFADLHPVEGIRGVFIASQLIANYSKSSSILGPEHLTSYISFDQGAQWKPLQPPSVDADGNTINCSRAAGCSLHLSQELSKLYPATQTIPIMSKKSAPGLILGTGTVGTSLKGHAALYLSIDAGVNWYQVLRSNYLYTFGDHGGIIMAVQLYQVNGTTNTFKYSTDEGETWHDQKFHDEELRIYGLMTEPGENTTVFTLFGSKSEKHQWIFIKVDMKPVFQYPCNIDDYKTWSPSDGRSGRKCLLGRKEVYERRVPHSNCFNGVDYDRPISVENCPCDRDDFECDFGFKESMITLDCMKDPDDTIDPYAVPVTCTPGHFYNRTKGYRKVPGDTCEGGREYRYVPAITSCPVLEEQEFLLVSTRQEIMRYDLVNPQAGLEPLPIPGLKMVIALDFDMENNSIYWSDVDEKKIKRLIFDGHHVVETLVDTNLQSVEGLALDWISKNLYFVDGERKTLEVIRTDIAHYGRMRRTLLDSKVLDNPRGLAVHPVQGFLYITDWSESKPMVGRSYLDGTNLTVLFGANVVGWPNGITIDFQTDRIFFADAKLDYIASAELDGKNMRKIIDNSEKVMQPFALGVFKSLLFWDDWSVHQVLQADKETGLGISPISNYTRKGLVDLKVFGHFSQQGTNSCVNRTNSPCSHLCMGRGSGQYSCLCPDAFKTKKVDHREVCLCPDGSNIQEDGTCISLNKTCATNFFQCKNGRCIPRQWVCDSDNDCGDTSDENEETCGRRPCEAPAWQCNNGHCIAPSWRCDYDNDCGDHSDEDNCHYETCPENTFRCNNGRCIHRNWQCDREDDCRDGSDEANCTSSEKHQCRGISTFFINA
ncbi:Sortilin-related receptor [Halocaridina rubra]|uniref:Sortilin-related receptor n=1 Tax=Halocaridina rubra TaxID=373956 RepID=A0AAN8XDN9_HALRR